MWVKLKPPDRRFESLVPFTTLLFWIPIFHPQPHGYFFGNRQLEPARKTKLALKAQWISFT